MDQKFADKIIAARGDVGKELLATIPNIIEKYEKQWSIKVLPPYALSFNYVAPAITSEGAHVVFKMGLHGIEQFLAEHDALKIFNGDGVVKILQSNIDDNVMLLEQVEPGNELRLLEDDEEATRIIAAMIKKIPKPVPQEHSFPTLAVWFEAFDRLRKKFAGKTGPLPEKLIAETDELYHYLLKTSGEQLLLHGDLHHGNILSSDRDGWLAIDPDAVIGERAFESGVMLHNPHTRIDNDQALKETLAKRISIFSEELGIDKERIRQWGVAQNVLSAVWTVENNGPDQDWQRAFRVAETLIKIYY